MNELAQDSALPPQITLKPILSSATMTTAKQSDFKSSSFRGEYTHELDSVLAHPLHIGEVRDGPQQRCWNQMIFKGPFQPIPFCDSVIIIQLSVLTGKWEVKLSSVGT